MRSPVSLRGLLTLLEGRPEPRRLRERLAARTGAAPVIAGVSAPARPYLVAGLAYELAAPLLYVTRDDDQVEPAAQALNALASGSFPVRAFPALDALPSERLLADRDTIKARMNALILLSGHASGPAIVVCSARALTQPVMPPEEFRAALMEIRPGDRSDPHSVLRAADGAGLRLRGRGRRARQLQRIAAASLTSSPRRWSGPRASSSSATRSSPSAPSTRRRSAR